MKISFFILVVFVNITFSQNLFDGFNDGFLNLHPFVNYQYNSDWQFEWDKKQLKNNSLRINYGSITTSDFQGHLELILNQKLGNGWRFKGTGFLDENRYNPEKSKYFFVGLEKQVFDCLSVSFTTNPTVDKEYMDLAFGLLISDYDRSKYLQLEYVLEDFMYSEKNHVGGKDQNNFYSLNWKLRYGIKKLWFYSEGKYTNGFNRVFDDTELSKDILGNNKRNNFYKVKGYYKFSSEKMLSICYGQNDFFEEVKQINGSFNYNDNILDYITIEYIDWLSSRHRIRINPAFTNQDRKSATFIFSRKDLLIGLFYAYQLKRNLFEVGYLYTSYKYNYTVNSSKQLNKNTAKSDKINISWTYKFENNSKVFFSLSHEISLGGFGGANIRYQMFF